MATDPHAGQGRSRADIARGPGALRRFMLLRMASISYPGTEAEQLLLAPQDLRTADPSFEIRCGPTPTHGCFSTIRKPVLQMAMRA